MNNIIYGKGNSLLVEIINHLMTMNLKRKMLEESDTNSCEIMADLWDYLASDSSNRKIKPITSTNQQLFENFETDIICLATYIVP